MERKIHLINWNIACSSNEKGGLGICSLSTMNRALLRKWLWRFAMEEDSPWNIIIRLKYDTKVGGWFTKNPRGSGGVGLWRDISKEPNQLKHDCCFSLGDVRRIKFWEDVWCGENSLRVTFPSLYLLVDSKGALATEVWNSTRGEGAWNPKFVQPFNDWELVIVQRFIGTINNKKVNLLEKDNLSWKIDGKGRFIVVGGTFISVPTKLLWNSCVPPKVGFFTWEAWWGKVLTTKQLKKRGFQLANRCPLCEKAEEKLEHLLIHCPSIWGLWVALIPILGLDWACPRLVKEFPHGLDPLPY